MSDFLYHALGFCGEHWHPNFLNISLIFLSMFILYKIVLKKIKIK